MCACNLSITLKCSAINNLALAQILHHFYNTRLEEQEIEDLDKYVTTKYANYWEYIAPQQI